MIIKEVKTYKFEEATPELKEKILKNYRDINVDDEYWFKFYLEEKQEELEKYGFEDAEIYFSGFYSQGDGACFDAKINTIALATNLYGGNKKFLKTILNAIDRADLTAHIIQCGSAGHYSHANTRQFEVFINNDDKLTDRQRELIDNFEKDGENWREMICSKIYKELGDIYEEAQTDEAVAKTLILNEYDFNEQGKIF